MEALTQRFPPLDAAQVRQLAIDFQQGSTPVDLLVLRLVDAGLTPAAAQELIRRGAGAGARLAQQHLLWLEEPCAPEDAGAKPRVGAERG